MMKPLAAEERDVMSVSQQSDDMFEVCCPDGSSLSSTLLKATLKVHRLGTHNDYDLSTTKGVNNAFKLYAERRPKRLCISTPCGPTSTIQRLNQRTQKQVDSLMKNVSHSRRIIRNTIKLCEHHLAQNPASDGLGVAQGQRRMATTRGRVLLQEVREPLLRGDPPWLTCGREVLKPEEGEPIKKPWRIRSTS